MVDSESPDVRLIGLVKQFAGGRRAVDNIDLDVLRGEYLCLLGPSGCGKTTTLRMIAGLEIPSEGQIILRNEDVTYLPAHRRLVNTVFQSYLLFPHLDVGGNITFGLRMKKWPTEKIGEALENMLRFVSLQGYADRKPMTLSGGEQQRVAIARALVNQPVLLLLDEPLGALDKNLRDQMQRELKAIQKRVGISFLHVTHDQEEAMALGDRIAVMHQGRVAQIGSPRSIYEDPSNEFVARFVGDMNFLSGKVSVSGSSLIVEVPGVGLLRGRSREPLREGAPILIGVRPEKVRLQEQSASVDEGINRVECVVSNVTYLGTRVVTTLIIGASGAKIMVSGSGPTFADGTTVNAVWSANDTIALKPN